VSAALALEGQGERPDAVFFATTTSPTRRRQGAATIAAVLDLPSATRTADFTDTLRAGTSALLAGSTRSRAARGACWSPRASAGWASPTRASSRTTAMPARGAARRRRGRAEVIATHSIADEFPGHVADAGAGVPEELPGAFEANMATAASSARR